MSPARRPPARTATVSTALQRTVASLAIADVDAGAVQLARRYAAAIDAEQATPVLCESCQTPVKTPYAGELAQLGPKLLAVLVELGATPGARKAVRGGADDDADGGPAAGLDALRAAGDQGLDHAAAVYAAATGTDPGHL